MNARLAHIAADQIPVFREIRWGLVGSFALHLFVVLFAWFGLPTLLRPPPEIERPILVDLVPISDKTNPPPKAPDMPEPPKAEPVKPEPPQPEPPKPEPPKPEPPKPEPPKPPPPKPEPKPEPPKPEPPKPQPKPEPKPEVTLPKPDAKPKPKPEPKPEPPPDDFASVLKSVDKFKKTQPPTPPTKEPAKPQAQPQPVQRQQGSLANIASEPVTMSERDAIRAQIERNWNPPVGAKDAENLVIEIRILLNPDGSLRDARIVDTSRYNGDGFFRAAADSAVRAVHKSSPLKFPPQKYDQFQDFTLVFNPKEMFGR